MEYNGVKKVFEISLTENEIKEIIEKYFLERKNKKIKLIIKTTTQMTGYFGNESEYAKTRYYLEEDVNIIGLTKKAKIELVENEIKEIIKEIFIEYEITYISFKSSFEHKYQYEFKEPVFNGVNIYYLKKKKEKSDNNEDWSLCRKL